MNKLEEQASAKAELSYSYWAARQADQAPAPQPKKLTEEEAAAAAAQQKHTELGASAWNAAGTFEERSLSLAWVEEQLGQLLCQLAHSHQGTQVVVMELTSCSGEAHQWIVRGKKRAGFELNFEFKWLAHACSGSSDGIEVVTGTAKVPHAAADELDELQLEVSPDTSGSGGAAEAAAAHAAVSSLVGGGVLEGVLQQLLERMRQK